MVRDQVTNEPRLHSQEARRPMHRFSNGYDID
jgi:hypothetical protein